MSNISRWTEIARREYNLNDTRQIPRWKNQSEISKHHYMSTIGMGWVAKRREVEGDMVVEKILWRENDRADSDMCF